MLTFETVGELENFARSADGPFGYIASLRSGALLWRLEVPENIEPFRTLRANWPVKIERRAS